jgi:hypothetical protein
MKVRFVVIGALAAALCAVGPARAQAPLGDEDDENDTAWSMSMLGGAVIPIGDTAETHRVGALALARVAWTSRVGVGAEVMAGYSPLPRHTEAEARTATHYGLLVAGPHFTTYWWSTWRLTAALDAGAAVESVRRRVMNRDESDRTVMPVVGGCLRGELRLGDRGAVTIGAGFHQHLGSRTYQTVETVAGLALTF